MSYGWVLALDAVSGEAVWVSGPMELLAAQLVLSDTTLLVASEGGQGGSGFVYGLNKVRILSASCLDCLLSSCPLQLPHSVEWRMTAPPPHDRMQSAPKGIATISGPGPLRWDRNNVF